MQRSGQSDSEAPARGTNLDQDPEQRQAWFRTMWESEPQEKATQQEALQGRQDAADDAADDDDFGEEFDEFAEGGTDEDFGDMEFGEAEEVMTPTPAEPSAPESHHTTPTASILAGLVSSLLNDHTLVQPATS